MAFHKSAKKRIRVSARRKETNKGSVSKLKTLTKKVFSLEKRDEEDKTYKEAISFIDKMTSKGRIHKNTAARRKSRLTKALNKLAPPAPKAPLKEPVKAKTPVKTETPAKAEAKTTKAKKS
jgi:small subunit ribosomal protein S20